MSNWYLLRIIKQDLVQIVAACNTEKMAREQLDLTREKVETNVSHIYKILEVPVSIGDSDIAIRNYYLKGSR